MKINSRSSAFAALAGLWLAGGCAGTPPPAVGTLQETTVEASGQEPFAAPDLANYRLLPTDVVSVTVYREADLSLPSVVVGADGNIAMPLVGSVRAEGRTPGELADALQSALGRGFLVNPQVAVNVLKYDSHVVTVEGAVKTRGVYPFSPGARLSSAIALAQGPERTAKLDQVAIFRRTADGLAVAKFDYRAIQSGTMLDPLLQPGDRVVMGTSGLSQFWQDVIQSLPAFTIFTNFATR